LFIDGRSYSIEEPGSSLGRWERADYKKFTQL
jgi:hypothetical protein